MLDRGKLMSKNEVAKADNSNTERKGGKCALVLTRCADESNAPWKFCSLNYSGTHAFNCRRIWKGQGKEKLKFC